MLPQFAYLFLMDLTKIRNTTFEDYSSNEPGFADAMLQAYIAAFSAPPTGKLSHDFLKKINRIAMSHRGSTGDYKTVANNYKVYFPQYQDKYVPNYSATYTGLMEFLLYWRMQNPSMHGVQFKSVKDPKNFFLLDLIEGQIVCLEKNGQPASHETVESLISNIDYECIIHSGLSATGGISELTTNAIQKTFDEFDEDMRVARTEDEKLYAIAKQVQHVAQAHPFNDGNIRTTYIALNKLLRDRGLRLSILLDPNRLDCCDLKLIVTMIKEGQRIYSNLLTHRDLTPFLACTTDSYFETITCPLYDIGSHLTEVFLHEVALKESLLTTNHCHAALYTPAPNQEMIDKFSAIELANPECRPMFIKHISAKNYDVALRNACLHRECKTIDFLLDNCPDMDLNGTSKNGNTALDWLEQHEENVEIKAVKSRLVVLGAIAKNQKPCSL